MKKYKTKSDTSILQIWFVLLFGICVLVCLFFWKAELIMSLYFSDGKTILLNGIIILMFFSGMYHLFKALSHYSFEEKELWSFDWDNIETRFINKDIKNSIIRKRFYTIKGLYDRRIPVNHGVLSSIMTAEESLYQSYPKFINNVLILTGVFGTIVSLILALVGASSILNNALPGEGIGDMLSGMNTALTTSATAIVCFFVFTYFYQRFTDIQTFVFAKIEEIVVNKIIPHFAFDSETVNHETKELIREINKILSEAKENSEHVRVIVDRLNDYGKEYIDNMNLFIKNQDMQQERTETVINRLEHIHSVLMEGFRLGQ
jgi:hypothetical protein